MRSQLLQLNRFNGYENSTAKDAEQIETEANAGELAFGGIADTKMKGMKHSRICSQL